MNDYYVGDQFDQGLVSSTDFSSVLMIIGYFIAIFLLLVIIALIVRKILMKKIYVKQTIFLIKLQKEETDQSKSQPGMQQYLGEEISKTEAMIAALGGLRAQRGFKAWLTGRTDYFSLEVVANRGVIAFYVVAASTMKAYLEKQIHAYYPDAVVEEASDYNFFDKNGSVVGGYLRTVRNYYFPIKTYLKEDVDNFNSLLNTMSKLKPEEGMAIQYVVRSAKGVWHKRVGKFVKQAYKLNSIADALKAEGSLGFLFSLMNSKSKKDDYSAPVKSLSSLDQEILKEIQDKNSKAGLDVNLRVIVSAKTKEDASIYLNELVGSFSQFNLYDHGNGFTNKLFTRNQEKIISDFIHRRFDENTDFLLNTEELASIFHLPLKNSDTPNILWLEAKQAAAPLQMATEGLVLGHNEYRGIRTDIKIKEEDRLRHTYIVGKSGVGKSILLANMVIQDIVGGKGVCVLDPHGDLIDDILSHVPRERAEDVVIFAPGDIERPLSLNLLEYDPKYPEQKSFVINEMIGIFDKLYDLRATGGPIFEQYMRNAMLLIMSHPESGSTLMEISKVLSDPDFRNFKLDHCPDQTVVDFWREEAEKAGGDAALANVVPYITSKLTSFISNDMMRPIIGQQVSSFNLREIMDNKKILLVSLPKGVIGEANAYLLGMILVGKILMAALSRADLPREKRNNFYLYLDEFQNFTTNSIAQILSEARKYGLGLVVAHQYIGQLVKNNDTTIKDAVFGNVGTMINFKVGPEDAEFLEKIYAPEFNQTDLVNVEKYTAFVRLLVDNMTLKPFSMKTNWPLFGQEYPQIKDTIKEYSRLKYGRDRNEVEAEIRRRLDIFK